MAHRQVLIALCLFAALLLVSARPDDGETVPLPGPGLSYGGIPYGSVSGNVAEFVNRKVPSSGRQLNYDDGYPNGINYAPIEQWL